MANVSDDLCEAFSGEAMANRRYLMFAKKADEEGFPRVARLFRAAAAAETVHANNHFRAMEGVKSTAENLQSSAGVELYEHSQMYPAFSADAESEGHRRALTSFRWALEVEKIHERFFRAALAGLQDDSGAPDESYFICPVCGNTVHGVPPERCPICNTPSTRFEQVD